MAESKTATGSTVEELIQRSRVTSVMWKWFAYEGSDVQQTMVICKRCMKTVTTKGGNTTNLFDDLKRKERFFSILLSHCHEYCCRRRILKNIVILSSGQIEHTHSVQRKTFCRFESTRGKKHKPIPTIHQ